MVGDASVVKYVSLYRNDLRIAARRFPRNSSPKKVAPAIKVIVWNCVFGLWAARGLSGGFLGLVFVV